MNVNTARRRWTARQQQSLRNAAVLFTSLGLLIYEAVLREEVRPALLVLYGSMMGLPALLRSEDRKDPPAEGEDS